MGLFVFDKANKEKELQREIELRDIQIEQLQKAAKELKNSLNAAQLIEEKNEEIIVNFQNELTLKSTEIIQLKNEREAFQNELEELQKQKTELQKLVETLAEEINKIKEKLKKKDDSLKDEQRIKAKYKFLLDNGAMDFTKAIKFFNKITDYNLNETTVRSFLVQNNIIYKAGRNYAPTQYAKDFNYVVVYGEEGTTPPKYTHDFLIYLKEQVKEGNLK
jgi:DNA repair exonuclease SbcCD ATPase subunit